MRKLIAGLWRPVALGFVATAPFFALEFINRRQSGVEFPMALFVAMWLMASVAVLTFRRVFRAGLGTPTLTAANAVFAVCFAVFMVTATVWIRLVNDQMPCFLGVPNCD